MSKIIRIGTRDSELALWQATTVQKLLEDLGYKTTLVEVKSMGDLVLDKPLYELGITGIFTKTLDVAMLSGAIDIAVHSMKDVPTALPQGIVQVAVLPRADTSDILLFKNDLDFLNTSGTIATGSLRRKAQWLNKYPSHTVENLRGNVNTRLKKLAENNWNGAIFAKAGLERINLLPEKYTTLDWMIPAPAQGAVVAVAMENDDFCKEALQKINHKPTAFCVKVERDFLRKLEGGCTAPIGALATITDDILHFTGVLFSIDGKQKVEVKRSVRVEQSEGFGKLCAQEVLENGGAELMKQIKKQMEK
ncbi:MAG: hydroxymethylbilane synthase [Flavobacteriaceae bacterium]|nr:hydroxymethylbilane synthase [Flavobacteriaceae bacterium]